LTLAASGSSWLAARQRLRPGSGHVVAIAGPGLARAQHEVAGVSAAWPSAQQLVGADATGPAVLSAIDGADLVHIAAHGRHQRDSPLFSSINLADGPVVGYDLDRLRQPPQTAVLSACELGQATARPGDEALGLTRALLHSGTSTVISGVAKVSDAGAAALMIDYHQRLSHGHPPAVALAASLQAAPEPLPFVCFGAGW
jgi:CHAT domain-containing protein